MRELAVCEICSRVFPATMMQGRSCPHCAKPLPTPSKVDFYTLADDGEKPVDRICKDCGAHFIGARNQRRCQTCQERHKREAIARGVERFKARHGGSTKPRGVCVDCGAPTSSKRHKRCAACAKIRRRKQVDAWWRKERHGEEDKQ